VVGTNRRLEEEEDEQMEDQVQLQRKWRSKAAKKNGVLHLLLVDC
jgi:hypothetical protein